MAAWRQAAAVMRATGIPPATRRATKGRRHGFGARAIGCGVPPDMLGRRIGHVSLEATAAYANALRGMGRSIGKRRQEGSS
jgi:hypothetical protein